MRPLFLLLAGFLIWTCAPGQETTLEEQLENAAAQGMESGDDSAPQQLLFWQRRPLNLNTAGPEDLQVFSFLTPLQIGHFIRYRRLLGNLADLYELQAVPFWDEAVIRKLAPFVIVKDPEPFARNLQGLWKEGQHQLVWESGWKVEKERGFAPGPGQFTGGPVEGRLRYRLAAESGTRLAVLVDKDRGEPLLPRMNRGGAFVSGHLFLRRNGLLKEGVLGDFTVNMGQGLVHWQGAAFGKGASVLNIKRQAPVLRPYASPGAFYFSRGLGLTLGKGNWEVAFFGSFRRLGSNGPPDTVTSFYTSGLYRTALEAEKRGRLGQLTYGGSLRFKGEAWSLAVHAAGYRFSQYLKKEEAPYNRWAVQGRSWGNGSLEGSYTWKNIHFFGEAAADRRGAVSALGGALVSLHPKADLALFYRHFSVKYGAVYPHPFSEGGTGTNEVGWYTGLTLRPAPGWLVDLSLDTYLFPGLKFRADAPARGSDFLLRVTGRKGKRAEAYTQYRFGKKEENGGPADGPLAGVLDKPAHAWRTHLVYKLSSAFVLKKRAEVVWLNESHKVPQSGFLVFTEGQYRLSSLLSAQLRLQYVHTASSAIRMYVYESALPGQYVITSFSQEGFRYYICLQVKQGKRLSFSGRWSQTLFAGPQKTGSGAGELVHNRRSELRIGSSIIF